MTSNKIATSIMLPELPSLRARHAPHFKREAGGRAFSELLRRIDTSGPQLQPRPDGWGGLGAGRWFEVDPAMRHHASRVSAVGGTCAKCGRRARAIDLQLKKRKDGSEIWACAACTGR